MDSGRPPDIDVSCGIRVLWHHEEEVGNRNSLAALRVGITVLAYQRLGPPPITVVDARKGIWSENFASNLSGNVSNEIFTRPGQDVHGFDPWALRSNTREYWKLSCNL